ncbi:hypothetical protein QO034_19580 [Sedimentitalea sp. JM2-8]|uniref:Uncharacterized protein n=1 Tax=Sedimentitalea xiamensis TaxID=3050037 RepID=A0ABT7FJH4_9RHOB|nr:hypothetical protein [Sedimentitalea xiamensis]MDK3075287.1 hypothetical protein [Sedimentitalea xiamensis]
MKTSLLVLPILALAAGCVETDGSIASGSNTSGGSATASINPRSGGGYTLVLSTQGNTCTAIYENPAPGGTELRPLNCSGDGSGNATVSYDTAGAPVRVTFGGVGIGSGTIRF